MWPEAPLRCPTTRGTFVVPRSPLNALFSVSDWYCLYCRKMFVGGLSWQTSPGTLVGPWPRSARASSGSASDARAGDGWPLLRSRKTASYDREMIKRGSLPVTKYRIGYINTGKSLIISWLLNVFTSCRCRCAGVVHVIISVWDASRGIQSVVNV